MQPLPSRSKSVLVSRRIPRACTGCRKAKARCSGKSPCVRCCMFESDCVFVENNAERLIRVEEQLDTIFEILKKMLDVNSASLPPHPKSPTQSHHATLPPPSTDSLPLTSRCQMLGPDIGNYFPITGDNRNTESIVVDEVPNQFQHSTPSTDWVWSGPCHQGFGAPWKGESESAFVRSTISNHNRLHDRKGMSYPEGRKAKISQSTQSETSEGHDVAIASELDSAARQHIANSTGVETWQGNFLASSSSHPAAPVEAWLPCAQIYREVEQLDQSTSQQHLPSHQMPTILQPTTTEQSIFGLKNTPQRRRSTNPQQ